jgi:hypothetical protein
VGRRRAEHGLEPALTHAARRLVYH